MSAEAPIVSHGRGGAGNINPDDTKYVDGEITRQGAPGSHGDGAFSTGRGGAANIADAEAGNAVKRTDEEHVPESAVRPSTEQEYHTGRGGAGNAHHVGEKGAVPVGLADKLKSKIMSALKK
ncbi:uncharacterized protein MKZ38_010318 [Zalerion maritima]|uniref:Uncharacterized protein n=1 Tax=Zalerion maritima TaxID=339359 RepID=A0AAD5RSH4_9PEZI|nr:uncharacterized protein MKZ38_010318 [Zalerion maritima]